MQLKTPPPPDPPDANGTFMPYSTIDTSLNLSTELSTALTSLLLSRSENPHSSHPRTPAPSPATSPSRGTHTRNRSEVVIRPLPPPPRPRRPTRRSPSSDRTVVGSTGAPSTASSNRPSASRQPQTPTRSSPRPLTPLRFDRALVHHHPRSPTPSRDNGRESPSPAHRRHTSRRGRPSTSSRSSVQSPSPSTRSRTSRHRSHAPPPLNIPDEVSSTCGSSEAGK